MKHENYYQDIINDSLKVMRCNRCGFPVNRFVTFKGAITCEECMIAINNLNKPDRQLSEEGVKSIPEADSIAVLSQPEDLTVGEAYKSHGKQLKINWYE